MTRKSAFGLPNIAGIFFVTLRQQKLVETISFNELFLCLGKKWSLFGHFDPKMTPKRKKTTAPRLLEFSTAGALFVDKSCAAGR